MNRKHVWLMLWLMVLVTMLVSVAISAEISVGVSEGDWMEYNVTYTGTPPDEYPSWVRIEVQSVQGTSITLNVERELLNGTSDARNLAFSLESGAPDLIVIPANLNSGDTFYHEGVGNVAIDRVEDLIYAGAERAVVYASVSQIEFHWDRVTGFLVDATQFTVEFTQNWEADKTNMWQPQLFGVEPIVFYALIIAVIAIVATVTFFVIRRRKTSPLSS